MKTVLLLLLLSISNVFSFRFFGRDIFGPKKGKGNRFSHQTNNMHKGINNNRFSQRDHGIKGNSFFSNRGKPEIPNDFFHNNGIHQQNKGPVYKGPIQEKRIQWRKPNIRIPEIPEYNFRFSKGVKSNPLHNNGQSLMQKHQQLFNHKGLKTPPKHVLHKGAPLIREFPNKRYPNKGGFPNNKGGKGGPWPYPTLSPIETPTISPLLKPTKKPSRKPTGPTPTALPPSLIITTTTSKPSITTTKPAISTTAQPPSIIITTTAIPTTPTAPTAPTPIPTSSPILSPTVSPTPVPKPLNNSCTNGLNGLFQFQIPGDGNKQMNICYDIINNVDTFYTGINIPPAPTLAIGKATINATFANTTIITLDTYEIQSFFSGNISLPPLPCQKNVKYTITCVEETNGLRYSIESILGIANMTQLSNTTTNDKCYKPDAKWSGINDSYELNALTGTGTMIHRHNTSLSLSKGCLREQPGFFLCNAISPILDVLDGDLRIACCNDANTGSLLTVLSATTNKTVQGVIHGFTPGGTRVTREDTYALDENKSPLVCPI